MAVTEISGIHRQIAWFLGACTISLNVINVSPLLGPAQAGLYGLAILLFMLASGVVFIGLIFQRML